MNRLPAFFLSHGGGPWPYIESMRAQFAATEREFRTIPDKLAVRPSAVLVVTGHWEAPEFTISGAARPGMEYDYFGFPPHTYQIQYAAPGSPLLAQRVGALLGKAGIAHRTDGQRGFDHGTFVPLVLIYPHADIPVVMLSLKADYDPAEHLHLGKALIPLRQEGVLIVGSGLSYHNMRGFGRADSMQVSVEFESYLNAAVTSPDPQRRDELLIDWRHAPGARLAHPREDHLLPLMVVAGAADEDIGRRLLVDRVMGVAMASYQFGA